MSRLKTKMLALRYEWSPQLFFADLLGKRWMDAIIPFVLLVALILVFGRLINNYLTPYNVAETAREFAEFGFVAVGSC